MSEDKNKATKASTTKGIVWTLTGTAAQHGLRLIVLAVLARLLVPSAFGLAAAAIVAVRLFRTLGDLALGQAIVQRLELTDPQLSAAHGFSSLIGVFLGGVVFLTADLLATAFALSGLNELIRALSIVFVLRGISVASRAIAQRNMLFRSIAMIQLLSYFFGFALTAITLAFLDFGAWAIVCGYLGQAAMESVLYLIRHPARVKPSISMRELRPLLSFGIGATASRFANFLASDGDYIVVGRILGDSALGVYSRAYELVRLPAILFTRIVGVVLFPALSKQQKERAVLRSFFERALFANSVLLAPLSVATVVLAPEIVWLVLGEGWGSAVIPFRVMAISMLFRTSYKLGGLLGRSTGAVFQLALRQIVYAILVVGGTIVGTRHGLPGAATATAIAVFIHYVLLSSLGIAVTGLPWKTFVGSQIPGLFSAGLSLAAIWPLATTLRGEVHPVLTGAACCAVAFAVVSLTFRYGPRWLIGENGLWLRARVARFRDKMRSR